MRSVVYAIPGLMPPTAPNFVTRIDSPEDGSLLLLLHKGTETDVVTWTLKVNGWRDGVVKDPDYDYVGGGDYTPVETPEFSVVIPGQHDDWQQFMKISSTIPENCLIPMVVCNGIPRPIDELHQEENPTYFYLKFPIRSLPIGDSVVSACINGTVREYIVNRPEFDIHRKGRSLTDAYKHAGKSLDITNQ